MNLLLLDVMLKQVLLAANAASPANAVGRVSAIGPGFAAVSCFHHQKFIVDRIAQNKPVHRIFKTNGIQKIS